MQGLGWEGSVLNRVYKAPDLVAVMPSGKGRCVRRFVRRLRIRRRCRRLGTIRPKSIRIRQRSIDQESDFRQGRGSIRLRCARGRHRCSIGQVRTALHKRDPGQRESWCLRDDRMPSLRLVRRIHSIGQPSWRVHRRELQFCPQVLQWSRRKQPSRRLRGRPRFPSGMRRHQGLLDRK